ncbi:hypothetical protein BSKO_08772 [Bryopsis sp. KO-2023]|nr:hypothetical protein BSKO_08772 [Bryopsis sp. KO-2023]
MARGSTVVSWLSVCLLLALFVLSSAARELAAEGPLETPFDMLDGPSEAPAEGPIAAFAEGPSQAFAADAPGSNIEELLDALL